VDAETGQAHRLRARVVVNATGVFADGLRRLDDPEARPMVRPSQGVHLVLDRSFLPGDSAVMVPHTDDGRVLFAIPWHGRTVVGTTDTAVPRADLEPRALEEEIAFLLEHAARYLSKDPSRADVLSVFAGQRPLVASEDEDSTAALSRDHTINISRSGLVTVTGGKWTTYRKMAEDTVDHAVVIGGLEDRPCVTRSLRLHGYHADSGQYGELAVHGSDAPEILDLARDQPGLGERLHPDLPYLRAEVVWAARREMARTVEDVLSRRTRALLLDARASVAAAPVVAGLLAGELGWDGDWAAGQVAGFEALARGYVLD
jgi:glycerol-3-phosphate dehydrogenase